MIDIAIKDTMPVYILYQTMWLDDNGELVYGPDVYKRDQKLIQALQETGALNAPENS